MMWGIERKLEEHTKMIDSKIESKLTGLQDHVTKLDTDFHVYKLDCLDHRRRFDDCIKSMTLSQQKTEISQENTERNVQCIKTILETYLPNLKDAEEKRATKHQLKEGALWISAIITAMIATAGFVATIWAYVNGHLNNLFL